MTLELIFKAFKYIGISPLNPTPILNRFNLDPLEEWSLRKSSTSILSASDWRKIERLLRSTVKDLATEESRKLSQTIHSISIQKQLLEHKNKGLREALNTKKRR